MSEETRQENSFALQAVIAIAYGLTAGFFLAVLYWLTDDMAAAYFGQATDVVLLFLQAALNRAVLAGLVTFLLAEGLLFWLKRNVPSFSQKAQAVFVFLFSAGILGAFMLSFVHTCTGFRRCCQKKAYCMRDFSDCWLPPWPAPTWRFVVESCARTRSAF